MYVTFVSCDITVNTVTVLVTVNLQTHSMLIIQWEILTIPHTSYDFHGQSPLIRPYMFRCLCLLWNLSCCYFQLQDIKNWKVCVPCNVIMFTGTFMKVGHMAQQLKVTAKSIIILLAYSVSRLPRTIPTDPLLYVQMLVCAMKSVLLLLPITRH